MIAEPKTIHVRLIAKTNTEYINYIFQKMDDLTYINVVQYPNWKQEIIDYSDVGFLTYIETREGITEWYDVNINTMIKFKTTGNALISFINSDYESNKIILF